jgi:ribose transport system substrate-binding protein
LTEYDEKNIPVFFADTDFNWEGKTAFIGTNNSHLGKMAGELLGSMLYPGNQVAFIKSNSVVANERITSAKEALESVGIEIIIQHQGYDKYRNMKSVMDTILKEYPNIKGILAVDDNIALEAIEEIKENELMIPVVGVDGTTKMLESVIDGTLNATVSQNPYEMGYVSVAQSLKVIKGQQVEKSFDSGVDIITQENGKEILKFSEIILK